MAGNAIGSPELVGVSVQRDGTLSFDRTKFLDQLAKNPSAVAGLLGAGTTTTPGMAARLQAVGDSAVASGTGQISTAIQGGQDRVRDLNHQIDDWDVRLSDRQDALKRQFTAMEVALGQLRQQSSWLAGQISSLAGSA